MSASLIILYVAFDMSYRGALEVWPHLTRMLPNDAVPTLKRALIGIGESAPIRDRYVTRGECHGCDHFDCR